MSRYDTDLWKELVKLQNQNTHVDILTITGFMKTEKELEAHVESYRKEVK